jgi:voltage-gated potassium channel Kch
MSRFLREPVSVRGAVRVIVAVTAVVVVLGGVLMRALDGEEFPNVWLGIWWALQTVTTVGYGDVTPTEPAGRIVAAFVMLEGIALLSIVTAAITSIFVARAQREGSKMAAGSSSAGHLDARYDDLAQRLDRIEAALQRLDRSSEESPSSPTGQSDSTG